MSLIPGWAERHKLRNELLFWTDTWDARMRSGKFWNDDVENLLREAGEWPVNGGEAALEYSTIRRMEGRAQALRILKEVRIKEREFFKDKTVVDIGPGAVCFLEQSDARLGIAIEPLARQFAAHRLLVATENTLYLSVSAEKIPLNDECVDVVVSRNNLDHVDAPQEVVNETHRILRSGGCFILIVHLEEEATVTEPHAFTIETVHQLVRNFNTQQEFICENGRTYGGRTLCGIYQKALHPAGG